jgi:hypothetical protein
MNERIKQLAEQAGGYVSLSHEHDGKLILSGEVIVQKFAELIVRECGEWCGHDHEGVVAMFKHFGVEE